MRFLAAFALTAVLSMTAYVAVIPILGSAPVTAEYWVREMLTIKQDIARKHLKTQKIVIASGSSTLFSIDTTDLSKAVGLPVINFGLMGGMPLDRILSETASISQGGDLVILALEPDYYCREETTGFDEWVLRNAIAWDFAYWRALSLWDRVMAIRTLGLRFPLEMLQAKFDSLVSSEKVRARLFALDQSAVLRKFANPGPIEDNLYSVYSMDALGNIKNTNENSFSGGGMRADAQTKFCKSTLAKLSSFVAQEKKKNVLVYFINTPYVALPDLSAHAVESASKSFADTLSAIAPVLDERKDLIFDNHLFLNSALHLNIDGRRLRTERLANSLRDTLQNAKALK